MILLTIINQIEKNITQQPNKFPWLIALN